MPSASELTSPKKSIKLPDPPVLSDGLDLLSKLRSNFNHHPPEVLRMDYIKIRCDGAAMGHITPRRRKDAAKLFATGEEMFNLLERAYGNPSCQHTAMNKFRALQMQDEEFNIFWAEFQRLAANLDHGDSTLISELTRKLIPSLQRQLTTGEKQPINP